MNFNSSRNRIGFISLVFLAACMHFYYLFISKDSSLFVKYVAYNPGNQSSSDWFSFIRFDSQEELESSETYADQDDNIQTNASPRLTKLTNNNLNLVNITTKGVVVS